MCYDGKLIVSFIQFLIYIFSLNLFLRICHLTSIDKRFLLSFIFTRINYINSYLSLYFIKMIVLHIIISQQARTNPLYTFKENIAREGPKTTPDAA